MTKTDHTQLDYRPGSIRETYRQMFRNRDFRLHARMRTMRYLISITVKNNFEGAKTKKMSNQHTEARYKSP
jgi:hypothetical protein